MPIEIFHCKQCGAGLKQAKSSGFYECQFCGTIFEETDGQSELIKKDILSYADNLLDRIMKGEDPVRLAACMDIQKIHDYRIILPIAGVLPDLMKYSDRARTKTTGDAIDALSNTIKNIGDPRAVDILIDLLQNKNSYLHQIAAFALEKLPDQKALIPLLEALNSGDRYLRSAAAGALGPLGDIKAVEPLMNALKDSSHYVKNSAAGALAKIGDTRAIPELIKLLKNKKIDEKDEFGNIVSIRLTTVRALGDIGDDTAAHILLKIFKEDDPGIRSAVNWTLWRIGDRSNDQSVKRKINKVVIL